MAKNHTFSNTRIQTRKDTAANWELNNPLLLDGEEILGICEIRHFLNSGLLKYGGHMGYGVAPKHRGHGYAAKMIEMAMPFMKETGIEMCLITCVEENIASAKSILNAGGVLENEVEIIRNGVPKIGQRYWVDVK